MEEESALLQNHVMEVENDEEEASHDDNHTVTEDSDGDGDRVEATKIRVLRSSEINTLDYRKKMCCIYFYYSNPGDAKYCTECFLGMTDQYSRIYAVREHATDRYSILAGRFCDNCRAALHQILPCKMCPVCTN